MGLAPSSLVILAAAAGLALTGCGEGNGGSLGPAGMPVVTRMTPALAAVGLPAAHLPSLGSLTHSQRDTVMSTFTESLGVDCAGCHAADYATETPAIRVTRKMWDLYARGMSFS